MMKQISLATTGYELITKRTRKRIFLEEMNLVVPWTELVGLIQPHASPEPTAKGGRPAFRIETMLRIHFLQQWFGLSDPAMEEAGYQGIEKRTDTKAKEQAKAKADIKWHIAMRLGKRKALNKDNEADALIDRAEKLKAGIRAKVEHPFRVIKRQFGYVKVRYRGLKKNTRQLITLFALSNLWMVRGKLMAFEVVGA